MKTAAAYIRVSTEEQTEYSPDSQLKAIRKYAKEHDMILPPEYVYMDEGISGRSTKRPAFQQMIGTAKMKPKPFDVILLWKFSRFARNRQDSIVYKSMLRKQCGIDVISISEQLSEDNTSVLIEALIEAMDEYYSLNLAEEVRRGMGEKFSRGGVVSQPPFGYCMKGGHFEPDDNADTVRMIYADFLGGMGYAPIARKLNALGIPTKNGNAWGNRNIEYVLTNPVYIGKLRRSENPQDKTDRYHEHAETVDGGHTPIISADVFEAVQKRRADIKSRYTRYARQTPAEFMLKGLCRCSACGSTLVAQQHGKYLQCHAYNRGECKVSHCISLSKLTAAVIDKLRTDISGETPIEISAPAPKSAPDIAQALARERKRLERCREAYEAGVDTLEEYKTAKAKIQARIDDIQRQAPTPQATSEQVRGAIRASMDMLTRDDISEATKNDVLRRIIERITLIRPAGVAEIVYRGVF